jgi:hypothetical protein
MKRPVSESSAVPDAKAKGRRRLFAIDAPQCLFIVRARIGLGKCPLRAIEFQP